MKNFKVLLYSEFENINKNSGLGKAVKHQEQALHAHGIEFTRDPKDDYDIAHINFYGPRSYHLARAAKRAGKKVVYHAHSTEEDFRNSFILSNKISPLFKKWLIRCYSLGDAIITPTEYSKKLLEGYGLKNIHAISNGIDTEFFTRDAALARRFREVYGFKPDEKVILGIGLYLERKGIIDFARLAERFPAYHFIWFGFTPLATIPREIRDIVNHPPKNLLFPGHVDAEMIRAAFSGCDLYLFPTFEETEGIPALEACSIGTPTIIRDIPVFDPWLIDGKNIYKAKDFDDFVRLIPRILNHELPDLSAAARRVAESRDVKKTGTELISVYETLLKNKN